MFCHHQSGRNYKYKYNRLLNWHKLNFGHSRDLTVACSRVKNLFFDLFSEKIFSWTSYLYVRYFPEPSWYSEFDGGFEKYFWWRGWNLVAENEKNVQKWTIFQLPRTPSKMAGTPWIFFYRFILVFSCYDTCCSKIEDAARKLWPTPTFPWTR